MREIFAPPGSSEHGEHILGTAVVRAAYIVLYCSCDPHESKQFIGALIRDGVGTPEHKIDFNNDMNRLTMLTWNAVCGYPRAAHLKRQDIEDVLHMRSDFSSLQARINLDCERSIIKTKTPEAVLPTGVSS
jgi:hypothetical protein